MVIENCTFQGKPEFLTFATGNSDPLMVN